MIQIHYLYNQRNLPPLGLPKKISDDENAELLRLLNLEEVKQTLFSIDPNKTQGPDGLWDRFLPKILEYCQKRSVQLCTRVFQK